MKRLAQNIAMALVALMVLIPLIFLVSTVPVLHYVGAAIVLLMLIAGFTAAIDLIRPELEHNRSN